MTRSLVTALLCLGLIFLPALAADDPAILKMPDGSTRQFDNSDQALSTVVEAVRAGQDGTMEVLYHGESLKVIAQGDAVEVTFGQETKRSTRAEFLAHMANAKDDGELMTCKVNLKNFATALEMWSSDHQGRYPATLAEITPDYLRIIMVCPAHGKDTYSSTYEATTNPDHFRLNCSGGHPGGTLGYPAYDSDTGLVEKP